MCVYAWDRIPRDIMHKVPTTLLHSLEGMPGLDWEKLLILQSQDGSFLFSPSSTAFALMQTKDENCLGYLKKAVHRFNGGGNYKLPFYPSIANKQNKNNCYFSLSKCACLLAFLILFHFILFLVPNVYPVDLFEHLWAVDRLQRLGISRYFQPEIKECINYVYRYNIYYFLTYVFFGYSLTRLMYGYPLIL